MTRRFLFPALAGLLPWNWGKPKPPKFHLIIEPTGPAKQNIRGGVPLGSSCPAKFDGSDVTVDLFVTMDGLRFNIYWDEAPCELARWMDPDVDAKLAENREYQKRYRESLGKDAGHE